MKKIFLFTFALSVIIAGCKQHSSESTENKSTEKSPIDSLSKQEITETRITPETLWKFGRISDAQLSPDGKTVIYNVTYYDIKKNKGFTDIFSVSTDGGEPKKLTDFGGHENNIRWSADGKNIYFLASESGSSQIWKMNADGSNQKQVSFIDGDLNGFELAPSGNNLFYIKDVKLEQTPQEKYSDLPNSNVMIITDLMYRHWNNWSDYSFSHIFLTKVENDKIEDGKDILENEHYDSPLSPYFDNAEISWSSDGKYIAYTCKKLSGKEYALSTNSDIYIYNIEKGITENITVGMLGYDKNPVFSNNGKYLAWQSMETPGYESDKDRLFIMNLETKEKKYLTENFDQNAVSYCWTNNDSEILFVSGTKATEQIYKIDVETSEIEQITQGAHDYTSVSESGDVIIGTKMSISMATEIFKIDKATGNETQLTFTNKHIYDKVQMGKVEERWVKTTDGKQMLTWLILPPNFDSTKKYPALLYCQGGPQSTVSQFFSYRWNFQIMAANDYVIIAPNRRGLPSFGQEWNAQISGDYGGQNMKDYISATDELKKEPFIDPNRLGAVGASYGGFSVFWLAGHHEKRFKAFISHCGMFNLESQYAATEEMFFVNHDLGGPYWEKNNAVAQKSYSNSPHKFVQNWDTPILIITGGYDFRIPYTESLQAFNAAKLVGVDAKLLFFPEETHFVVKPQNSILWQREFFGWLDKWLK
ncbi:MAG: peptidase S9 [Bacteroidetes bacterium GWA2_30_7]|nr:MAG: peptidase S9 [Bacteroidetes bacterium GWA2_30_7]